MVKSPLLSTGEGKVKMKWSCGHEGHLNLDWLRRNCYSARTLKEARRNSTPKYLQVHYAESTQEQGFFYIGERGILPLP